MRVKKLRQEMEKVRLLLELIRKRERTKRELVHVSRSKLLSVMCVWVMWVIKLILRRWNVIFIKPVTHTRFLPARCYGSTGLCNSAVSVRHMPILCLGEQKQDCEMYTI